MRKRGIIISLGLVIGVLGIMWGIKLYRAGVDGLEYQLEVGRLREAYFADGDPQHFIDIAHLDNGKHIDDPSTKKTLGALLILLSFILSGYLTYKGIRTRIHILR